MYDVTKIQDITAPDGTRVIYVQTCGAVCSQQIGAAVKDGVIMGVEFIGGCSGNTQGIQKLIVGMKVEDAISRLEGILCNGKPTSCPDQLARALKLFL